jgi:hypothetical protein
MASPILSQIADALRDIIPQANHAKWASRMPPLVDGAAKAIVLTLLWVGAWLFVRRRR